MTDQKTPQSSPSAGSWLSETHGKSESNGSQLVQVGEPLPRQHLTNHFLLGPKGEGARAMAFFLIFQYNERYRMNFVFGLGTWNNFCTKRDGKWVLQPLKVNG